MKTGFMLRYRGKRKGLVVPVVVAINNLQVLQVSLNPYPSTLAFKCLEVPKPKGPSTDQLCWHDFNLWALMIIWGFPNIWHTFFGVPIFRIMAFLEV